MFEEAFVPLALAFLALVFLAPLTDGVSQFLEKIMVRIPRLPNSFSDVVSFVVTVGVGYVICWLGKFDFYAYLNLQFSQEVGWLFTAILLAGGTKVLRQRFELANTIPLSVFGGLSSAVKRAGRSNNETNN